MSASNDAQFLTLALGGTWRGNRGMVRCVCHDDRTPSLSIRGGEVPGRLLFKCFAGCDGRDILAELRRRGLLDSVSADHAERRRIEPREPNHRPDPDALAIWRGARPSQSDDIVSRYLRGRGIDMAVPPSLRTGTKIHLDRYPMPIMVAGLQAPDGRVIATQSTFLTMSGQRAAVSVPRVTTGALGYGAVRLAKADAVLGLAEGIETALSAMQIWQVPVWATLGAGRMPRVTIPDTVRELHVFADNDDPGKAAAEATAKAHPERRVTIHLPPGHAKDWNDALRASATEAA